MWLDFGSVQLEGVSVSEGGELATSLGHILSIRLGSEGDVVKLITPSGPRDIEILQVVYPAPTAAD